MIFLTPLALIGLLALPALYWLVKATPPPPKEQAYPSLQILRRLRPGRADTARSPLWLLMLRLIAVALLIFGLAQPIWLGRDLSDAPSKDLVLVLDNGWASVPHWQDRLRAARQLAERRFRAGHEVTLLLTAPDPDGSMAAPFTTTDRPRFEERLLALTPHSWPADRAQSARQLAQFAVATGNGSQPPHDVVFLSDGVATATDIVLAKSVQELKAHASGAISDMRWPDCDTLLLTAKNEEGGHLSAAVSGFPCPSRPLRIRVRDEKGGTLGIFPLDEKSQKPTDIALPPLLRNRAARLALESDTAPLPGPSSLFLLDSGDRRHPVGLLTPGAEDTPLTGQGFFLAQAIKGVGELHRGPAPALLKQKLSVLIATDGTLGDDDTRNRVADWVRHGGVLIRFAGPNLAADAQAASQDSSKTLLPVPLMSGMRQLGGPMSWGKPQLLSAFAEHSPFEGLDLSKEVTVTRQVLAQPTTDLGAHVWARLSDGTPLVTAAPLGQGELVLFHVTGTADWSSLPLSGLLPAMLERLIERSLGQQDQTVLRQLTPFTMLDTQGALVPPPERRARWPWTNSRSPIRMCSTSGLLRSPPFPSGVQSRGSPPPASGRSSSGRRGHSAAFVVRSYSGAVSAGCGAVSASGRFPDRPVAAWPVRTRNPHPLRPCWRNRAFRLSSPGTG
ncbi:BatA domain-containing protein [Asaia astilbis]|uniref:BatA domain-containing protein n=1 Tax=Asaia astilbis TaxID=610244 RepID=UPI000AD9E7D5|nr:BatA domain-containing protein [Asaia astilbis]